MFNLFKKEKENKSDENHLSLTSVAALLVHSAKIDQNFTEKEKIIEINCIIYVERSSQKAILIGKNGSALTSLGSAARRDIQNFLKKKVFLGLYITS